MHLLSCSGELNHHGKPVCDEMYKLIGENYRRITTSQINQERLSLGYSSSDNVPYNICYSGLDIDFVKEQIKWSDVVEYGAAPEIYLHEAVKANKIVFIRMERLLKEGKWKLLAPNVLLRYRRKYKKYKNNPNVYYLCISAYAAADLSVIGIKSDRVLKWAYCPEYIPYDTNSIINNNNQLKIIWVGRMISWKHPEIAVKIARMLKNQNVRFTLDFYGDGEKINEITEMIKAYGLTKEVRICGSIESSLVRNVMLNADVFLGTSDKNEGWGVVINEAMNSGCVVCASRDMGSVPILITDGINGYSFSNNNLEAIVKRIIGLSQDKELLNKIKINAYNTIRNQFTPKEYALRLVEMSESALNGKIDIQEGLGSKSLILK